MRSRKSGSGSPTSRVRSRDGPAWNRVRSDASRVPRTAATIERRAVRLAPDHVVRPRRVDGEAEVVAVRECVTLGGLVRCTAYQIGQSKARGPSNAFVRCPSVTRVLTSESYAL